MLCKAASLGWNCNHSSCYSVLCILKYVFAMHLRQPGWREIVKVLGRWRGSYVMTPRFHQRSRTTIRTPTRSGLWPSSFTRTIVAFTRTWHLNSSSSDFDIYLGTNSGTNRLATLRGFGLLRIGDSWKHIQSIESIARNNMHAVKWRPSNSLPEDQNCEFDFWMLT